jgi:hypothetical protein
VFWKSRDLGKREALERLVWRRWYKPTGLLVHPAETLSIWSDTKSQLEALKKPIERKKTEVSHMGTPYICGNCLS